jgi:hypothetical protein
MNLKPNPGPGALLRCLRRRCLFALNLRLWKELVGAAELAEPVNDLSRIMLANASLAISGTLIAPLVT